MMSRFYFAVGCFSPQLHIIYCKCVVAEFPVTIMCLYKVRKTACSQLCVDALSSISKRVFIEFILLKEECLLNK